MKFDKQEIRIGGDFLIYKNINKLKKLFDDITIVTNTPDFYKNLGVSTIGDIYPGFGPISGLHTALYHSAFEYVYLMAVDMPIINEDYILYIDSKYRPDKDGLIYKNEGHIEPMHGIYNTRLLDKIEKLIKAGNYRIKSLVETSNFDFVSKGEIQRLVGKTDIFTNLNTQEDLKNFKEPN